MEYHQVEEDCTLCTKGDYPSVFVIVLNGTLIASEESLGSLVQVIINLHLSVRERNGVLCSSLHNIYIFSFPCILSSCTHGCRLPAKRWSGEILLGLSFY